MNITEELNQIMTKYQLDRYYPRFQMKLEAEKVIREIIKKTEEKAQIYLIGTDKEAVDYTRALIGKCRQTKCCIITDKIYDQGIWDELMCADKVYLVSFHNAEKAMELMERHHVIFENLYDDFLCHGLIFEDEYYYVLTNNQNDLEFPDQHNLIYYDKGMLQLEFLSLKKKYARSGNDELKNIILEKMLFLALYIKNFVEAKRCVETIQRNGTNGNVEAAWAEIVDLLDHIKEKLLQRKQKDVVWFWMDSVSFGEAGDMPYLNKMKEKTLSFNNAFTNMPFTGPTLRAAFCQKRNVADQSYKIGQINNDTSEMLSYLRGNGYHVKIISRLLTDSFEEEKEPEYYDAASINFWNALKYLLLDDEKLFILAHALEETHFPCLSLAMHSLDNRDEMFRYGRRELDEQLEFYGSFFGVNVMQIFMSDHGAKRDNGDFLDGHHINLDIYHRDITPRKVEEMFSILDFYPLVRQLIEEKKTDSEVLRREYVPVENLDRYNPADIKELFKNRTFDLILSFGYMGVISKDEIYVRFSIGNEYQHNRGNNSWTPLLCVESEIQNDNNLEALRQAAGIYPIEILDEEKFTYSRYLHELYKIYLIRRKELIQSLNTYMLNLLSDYEDGTVAIRTGGIHSYYLYAVLAENVQRKIGAFIDINSQCLCDAYDKKIIKKESLVEDGVKVVILSSFIHRHNLEEEALQYPDYINVIDIYDVFEQIGYSFHNEFYGSMGLREEDYDNVYRN